MRYFILCVCFSSLLIFSSSYASEVEVPVVDVTQNYGPQATQEQRYDSAPEISQQSSDDAYRRDVRPFNESARPASRVNNQVWTVEQRIARLEQQVVNMTRMNLPQQYSELQHEVNQLSGQLQVLAHDLKLLNRQQRTYYQDLTQQIVKIKKVQGSRLGSGDKKMLQKTDSLSSQTDKILKDSDAYQAAFGLLSKKEYDKAEAAFMKYLAEYRSGEFRVNAHYWLGEIYLLQKKLQQSEKEFTTVLHRFAKSSKVPDAKLKLAVVHLQMGSKKLAKNEFNKIKSQYPGTTVAQLANIRLQQLLVQDTSSYLETDNRSE